ncbi:uncharacterized protein LOC111245917 isoform X1 [Varroa destructor]|uniref:Uncharacterized protein n=1 Tax=Varroa destructor TaxID=109461 RepID=A0A7M7JDW7_VARDE|nr:uncharacterized protein LOC111245917 isoform X1 [Varroa destructor]
MEKLEPAKQCFCATVYDQESNGSIGMGQPAKRKIKLIEMVFLLIAHALDPSEDLTQLYSGATLQQTKNKLYPIYTEQLFHFNICLGVFNKQHTLTKELNLGGWNEEYYGLDYVHATLAQPRQPTSILPNVSL